MYKKYSVHLEIGTMQQQTNQPSPQIFFYDSIYS